MKHGHHVESTIWTLVERAAAEDSHVRREALEKLLRQYMPPLKAHLIARRRFDPHTADDLLQGFIQDVVLHRRLFEHADRAKGRFRNLLLTAIDRYVIDQQRKRKLPTTELGQHDEIADRYAGQSDVFDLTWARWVVHETLCRFRDQCREEGRDTVWNVFECRILRPAIEGTQPPLYEELVERFEFKSPKQASNLLVTARRQFHRILACIIREYVDNDELVIEEEIDNLRRILSAPGALDVQALIDTSGAVAPPKAAPLPVLGETNPHLLGQMLVCEDERQPLWRQDELGGLLRHQLAAPLREALGTIDLTFAPDLMAAVQDTRYPLGTIHDLFVHPRPPLELLEFTKQLGRRNTQLNASEMPPEVGAVIYFGSIALALVRCNERITSFDDEQLSCGFEQLLGWEWINPELRQVVQQAMGKLSTSI